MTKRVLQVSGKRSAIIKKSVIGASVGTSILALSVYGSIKLFPVIFPGEPIPPGPILRGPIPSGPILPGVIPVGSPEWEAARALREEVNIFVKKQAKYGRLYGPDGKPIVKLDESSTPSVIEVRLEAKTLTREQLHELLDALKGFLPKPTQQGSKQQRFKLTSIDYFGGSIEITDTHMGIVHKIGLTPFILGATGGVTIGIISSSTDNKNMSQPSMPQNGNEQHQGIPSPPSVILVEKSETGLIQLAADSLDKLLIHGRPMANGTGTRIMLRYRMFGKKGLTDSR